MRFSTMIFDFYGTVAEHDGGGLTVAEALAARGYALRDDLARAYWQDGLDGTTHDEHSRSRDHYTAWQRKRLAALLDECAVPRHLADEVADELAVPHNRGRMEPYPDSADVLRELADRGVQLAVCSNWDWDLTEAIQQTALDPHFELVVSSAWIGARKPHARIYAHMLEQLGADPAQTLFVGDTWNCDVEGPLRHGMRAAYVRRAHREPDHTRAHRKPVDDVFEFGELGPLLDLA